MPRISPEHGQEVRDRIVRAAMSVFAERGFHRATMQDIVRASGLSVGAIYTYFRSKSDLILAGCDLITEQEMGELRNRLAPVSDYRERISVAVGFFFDDLAGWRDLRGPSVLLLQAWAEADTDPAIREMLLRRRREIVMACAMILQEGVVRGALPAWLATQDVAHGIAGLLDGIILQSAEEGGAFRRADAERRVLAVIETMLAAAGTGEWPRLVAAAPRPYESVRAPGHPAAQATRPTTVAS
jgi:AcrR family transcriptional regulator